MKRTTALIISLPFALFASAAVALGAGVPPAQLVPAEIERVSAEKELIGGAFPGLLLVPPGEQKDTDSKYGQPYRAACVAYAADNLDSDGKPTAYVRRFLVHIPDASALPLAKRVAKMLVLLFGEVRERMKIDHPLSDATVDVWLTRQTGAGLSADVGGEQFKNQIYLYDIYAERKPIEWAREVAHEYGHFILPGVSGFTAPEEWANGALGERLFLKWLRDDLKSGRLRPEDLPIVPPDQLDDFVARRVEPLIRQLSRDKLDPRAFSRKDAAGMDAVITLALYLDTVYGARAFLDAIGYSQPQQDAGFIRSQDFLRGTYASIAGATEFAVTPPLWETTRRSDGFFIYIPRGEYTVAMDGSATSWDLYDDDKTVHRIGKEDLIINRSEWRKIAVGQSRDAKTAPRIVFRRRGAEPQ